MGLLRTWDVIIVHLLSKKVDINTLRSFELERDSDKLPTLEEFINYVRKRALAFENVDSNTTSFSSANKNKSFSSQVSHVNINSDSDSKDQSNLNENNYYTKNINANSSSFKKSFIKSAYFVQVPSTAY